MQFIVVVSKKDMAGQGIKQALQKIAPSLRIEEVSEDIIYAEDVAEKVDTDPDYIIFASRHSSKQARKTLSIHPPGNWGKAEYGGIPRELSKTSAYLLKASFIELSKQTELAGLDYEVTLEVTHHGPLCQKPCMFIEIGSSKAEWQDKKAAEVIAQTIKSITTNFPELQGKLKYKPALGLGGGHYCPKFNKVQLGKDFAFSHICPKYALPDLNEQMLKQALDRTQEAVQTVLLDWKGLGKDKQRILKLLEKAGLKYERV